MAGKKKRKRQTGTKKKDPSENIKVESDLNKEKKPKLDGELDEQSQRSDEHMQQPILKVKVEDQNNDVSGSEDLSSNLHTVEAEGSKYVPPFTRKPKRILKRDGHSVSPSGSPARGKRPWKGRGPSTKATQRGPPGQKTSSDVICRNKSPELRKEDKEEEEEEEIDVGMEEMVTQHQENKYLPVVSTSQAAATVEGFLSSSPSFFTLQEDISSIVMHVIDDVLDAICKHVNQCDKKSTSGECKEIKMSGEAGSNTGSDANICNEDSVTEAGVALMEPRISEETVIKPPTVLLKADTDDESCSLILGNQHRMRQWKENDKDQCDENDIVSSENEYGQESEAELNNSVGNGSTVIPPEVEIELLTGKEITAINEELHAINTSPIDVIHTEPNCADKPLANGIHLGLEKKHPPLSSSEHRLTVEHTATETDQKADMDTTMLDTQMSDKKHFDVCVNKENLMCQLISEQSLDQMVPNNYKNSTVISQETQDVTESVIMPNVREMTIDFEDVYVPSKPPSLSNRDEREDKNDYLDKKIDQVSVVETGHTKTTKVSNLESSQPLFTAQVSEVSFEQEPGNCAQVTVDQTVTGTKSAAQYECKQIILETEVAESHKTVQSEITESQTSKQERGCSLYDSDGDAMEFDSLVDCTDSQLVHVDEFLNDKPPLPSLKHNASNVAGNDTTESHVEVPSDRGMIKGLISELSTLNKFIMGAWKDLESHRKRRQARLKILGKGKKLK